MGFLLLRLKGRQYKNMGEKHLMLQNGITGFACAIFALSGLWLTDPCVVRVFQLLFAPKMFLFLSKGDL
jgi:hypothetical protein